MRSKTRVKREKIKPELKISPLTPLFLPFALLFCRPDALFMTFSAALLHEAGHVMAALFCGAEIGRITVLPLGADITLRKKILSYGKDLSVSAAGAAANLLTGIPCLLCGGNTPISLFGKYSLGLALFNLLPAGGLDGGELLRIAVSWAFGSVTAEKVCRPFSAVTIALIWLASVYMLFYTSGSLSLFILSFYLFVCNFVVKRKSAETGE